jgi:hypothetical protein
MRSPVAFLLLIPLICDLTGVVPDDSNTSASTGSKAASASYLDYLYNYKRKVGIYRSLKIDERIRRAVLDAVQPLTYRLSGATGSGSNGSSSQAGGAALLSRAMTAIGEGAVARSTDNGDATGVEDSGKGLETMQMII